MNNNLAEPSGTGSVRFKDNDSLARIERTFNNLAALVKARIARREQLLALKRPTHPTRSEAFRQFQHEKWLGKVVVAPTQPPPPKDLHRRILQDPNG